MAASVTSPTIIPKIEKKRKAGDKIGVAGGYNGPKIC